MGKPILIYHDGQKSLIDSDLIYVPKFEKKSDTMSKENKDDTEQETNQVT